MFRLITAVASCVACISMTSVADAQIVRVGRFGGGVSIRAPFVSVDVLPFGGGTRVRAPFTSVNTGAYRYGYSYPGGVVYGAGPVYPTAPVYPTPVYPTTPYATQVYPQDNDYQAARPSAAGYSPQRLRAAAQQLINSLSVRRDDSDVWLEYLAPNRIIDAIDRGESPDSLRTLLTHYDGVIGNPSLRSISSATGFAETHASLRAFVAGRSAELHPNVDEATGQSPPAAAPLPDAGVNQPSPAVKVKPAEKEGKKAEVEELPLPPVPTPI